MLVNHAISEFSVPSHIFSYSFQQKIVVILRQAKYQQGETN